MKDVIIKRIDKELPLPQFETHGSVGFDIYAREDQSIYCGRIALIPTNLIIEVPNGYMLMVTLRSSTPRKYHLVMPHGVGIIDQDYCGEDDEIMLQVMGINQSGNRYSEVKRGDRIAQGLLIPVATPTHFFREVDSMNTESRGGFGSTG